MNWFAELFVAMLLFYGPNMATTESAEVPKAIQRIFPERKQTSSSTTKGGPTLGSLGGAISNANANANVNTNAKAELRRRKLEERMGSGKTHGVSSKQSSGPSVIRGGGASSGSYGGPSKGIPSEPNSLIEEPSQYFPGNQQFFYRFVVLLDNHKLCQHLITSVFSEMHRLSPLAGIGKQGAEKRSNDRATAVQGSQSHTHGAGREANLDSEFGQPSQKESFLHTIVKLKILGKFLGDNLHDF